MKVVYKIKHKLNKRIIIMLIPYGKKNPLKINISLLFICVFMISWIALTLWSSYLASRHFDYVKTKVDNKVMHARLLIFANQLEKARNMFEKVQGNDEKIRLLLAMNTKKSILEEGLGQNFGEGGPTLDQTNAFAAILSGNLNKMNYSEISHETDTLYEQYKFMCRSYKEIISHIHKQKLLFLATPSGWPCGGSVSSAYGFRLHPIHHGKEFHSGLDIANVSNTFISSTAAGKVTFSGYRPGYGNVIVINHGQDYKTTYAHLSKRLVNMDAYVSRGTIIAKMGSTGTSTGSHLHYEIHFKGNPVNPKLYLKDYSDQSERERYVQEKIKKSA
ncbi:MAG: M23 family metallopeptidase [Endomicrobium sp.]|jgi:murein DD-endopeptidase MepM/ murein hydrolase activator NlpD|nr:M23 family metallopeptidase [Endomicrobium sp.]